ncbi:hypothetical protein I317_07161 [Kwoniella heveanensis CBS 569]|nr:hypothetical protein I317_07161 [Kwoniella heveanensis CBS 569]
MSKRLVMNPPASFLEYAASLQPDIPIPAGPLVISQSGQAVMLSPNANADAKGGIRPQVNQIALDSAVNETPEADTKAAPAVGEVVLDGSSLMLMPDPTTAFLAATAAMTGSTPTSTATPAITSASAVSTSIATQATSLSPSTPVPTSMTFSSTASSSGFFSSSVASQSRVTSTTSTSSAPSSSSSSSPSAGPGAHKPPSAGLIFLIILLALVIFIAFASLLRYVLKLRSSGRTTRNLCCFGRRAGGDNDDDLSDIVRFEGGRAYDPFSDGKEFNHHTMTEQDIGNIFERRGMGGEDGGLERRASLFAREGRSPFLHSGTSDHPSPELPYHEAGAGLGGSETGLASYMNPSPLVLPIPPAQAFTRAKFRAAAARGAGLGAASSMSPYNSAGVGREESIAPSLPGHLYGQTGPLEVRNALPGEVEPDEEYEDHHAQQEGQRYETEGREKVNDGDDGETRGVDGLVGLGLGGGSPRFLGVDGTGLSVPWSVSLPHRPSSIDSFDAHQLHPNPFGSSSTLTAAVLSNTVHQNRAAGLGGLNAPPMFSSPVPSHDTEVDDLSLPQRSATWASNLRNTLYNAINAASVTATARVPNTFGSGAGSGPRIGNEGDEDRFTRTVGAVVRASSRRKAIPSFAAIGDLEKGLQVVEEKDDPFTASYDEKCLIPPVTGTTGSAKMLSRIESGSSSSSGSSSCSTLMVLPRRKGATASERYKQYYARRKSVAGLSPVAMAETPSDTTGAGAESEVEVEMARPPALGAGSRAKGARTGSFVIV